MNGPQTNYNTVKYVNKSNTMKQWMQIQSSASSRMFVNCILLFLRSVTIHEENHNEYLTKQNQGRKSFLAHCASHVCKSYDWYWLLTFTCYRKGAQKFQPRIFSRKYFFICLKQDRLNGPHSTVFTVFIHFMTWHLFIPKHFPHVKPCT